MGTSHDLRCPDETKPRRAQVSIKVNGSKANTNRLLGRLNALQKDCCVSEDSSDTQQFLVLRFLRLTIGYSEPTYSRHPPRPHAV